MPGDSLAEKLRSGAPNIGLWVAAPSLVEVTGYVGFDWFMVDQMFSANDWQRTEELIRAGEAVGIPAVVRVQGFPWLGYDHRVAVDVARASGIGARYVMVPASGERELEECLRAARDWHRRVLNVHETGSGPAPGEPPGRPGTTIIPHLETTESLRDLDRIVAHPEVSLVFIAVTDASRALSPDSQPDFDSPELWEYLDRAVTLGRAHHTLVGANTGFGNSLDDMGRRVARLREHGITMVMVQGASFLFQLAATEILTAFRGAAPGAGGAVAAPDDPSRG